jgi:cytochrome c
MVIGHRSPRRKVPARRHPVVPRIGALAGVVLVGCTAALAQAPDHDGAALARKYDCTLCHADREPMAGPSWAEIAAKYHAHPRAAAILTDVVKKGMHGDAIWPMPPLPEVTDADAKHIVRYILEQKP